MQLVFALLMEFRRSEINGKCSVVEEMDDIDE